MKYKVTPSLRFSRCDAGPSASFVRYHPSWLASDMNSVKAVYPLPIPGINSIFIPVLTVYGLIPVLFAPFTNNDMI